MSVIFICAALLVTFTYTKPTWSARTGSGDIKQKSIAELREEKVKYEEALEKTREIERVRDGLQSKYNALRAEDHDRLNKFLPDGIDSVRMIVDLDNAARTHGLVAHDIVVIDPRDSRSGTPAAQSESVNDRDFFSYVNLNFNVTGTYDNLAGFLGDMEKSLRTFDVSKLNIDPAPPKDELSKSNFPEYKLTISLKVYYLN